MITRKQQGYVAIITGVALAGYFLYIRFGIDIDAGSMSMFRDIYNGKMGLSVLARANSAQMTAENNANINLAIGLFSAGLLIVGGFYRINQRFCDYCKSPVEKDALKCARCGSNLIENQLNQELAMSAKETDIRKSVIHEDEKNERKRNDLIDYKRLLRWFSIGVTAVFLLGGLVVAIKFAMVNYKQHKSKTGVHALFDPNNIGKQILAIEKKLDVAPFEKHEFNGRAHRVYESNNCKISILTNKNETVYSISTDCEDEFPNEFKIPGIYARHMVNCLDCGNAKEPEYILRVNATHAFPVITDYSLFLKSDGEYKWRNFIEAKEGAPLFNIADAVVNCGNGYESSARMMWEIEKVWTVTYIAPPSDDDLICGDKNHSTRK